jgi:outer membrane protein TolC
MSRVRSLPLVLTLVLTLAIAAAPLVAAAAPPLTLDAALAEAERANPDLAAARARLEQARANVGKVRAGYLPQLKVSGTYTHNSDEAKLQLPVGYALAGAPPSQRVVPSQVVEATLQARDQLGAQLELTQALLAPPLWYAVEAAGASARAQAASEQAARRELRFGVMQAFYAASAADQLVAIQERQVAVALAHEKDAALQVGAGGQPRLALLRAGIEAGRAEQDLVRARNAREAAQSALAALLGRGDAVELAVAPPAPPALPAELVSLEDEAVRRRPEIAAARAGVEAAAAGRSAVTARYLPTLGAFGQARWSSVAGFTGKEDSWAAGLAVSWTLFDGGAREAERREAGARVAEAEAARTSTTLRARDEVRRARSDLASARANRSKAEHQVTLARENQRITEVSFRAGQSTSLEATDANAALATAELTAVNEQLNADLAALRLLRAAGL